MWYSVAYTLTLSRWRSTCGEKDDRASERFRAGLLQLRQASDNEQVPDRSIYFYRCFDQSIIKIVLCVQCKNKMCSYTQGIVRLKSKISTCQCSFLSYVNVLSQNGSHVNCRARTGKRFDPSFNRNIFLSENCFN